MSLTSILKKEKGRQNLKNWFKLYFPNPGLVASPKSYIVPNSSSGNGEIGTAFDYLFRFNLERINGARVFKRDKWVAESGLEMLLGNIAMADRKEVGIGYLRERKVNKKWLEQFIEGQYELANNNYQKFLSSGKLDHELIKSAIFLAKLDVVVRTGTVVADIESFDDHKVEELQNLYEIVPWEKFLAKSHVVLNPTFGEGSTIANGADADFIIDGNLVDIKASKNFKLERADLNQIIGYLFLSFLGKVSSNKEITLNDVSIYFARYGYLWTYNIQEQYAEEKLKKLAKEFKRLVEDKNLHLVPEKSNTKTSTIAPSIQEYELDKEDFKCPYCESREFTKAGTTASGKFKYQCKDCKKNYSTVIKPDEIKIRFDFL